MYLTKAFLPSSGWWWWRKGKVPGPAAPTSSPAGRWRWRTAAGTHVVIVPPGGRHGATTAATWRHPFKAPPAAHGEPAHGPAAALLKHHGEAAIVIGFIVEVGVIWLGTTLNWSLTKERNQIGVSTEGIRMVELCQSLS